MYQLHHRITESIVSPLHYPVFNFERRQDGEASGWVAVVNVQEAAPPKVVVFIQRL